MRLGGLAPLERFLQSIFGFLIIPPGSIVYGFLGRYFQQEYFTVVSSDNLRAQQKQMYCPFRSSTFRVVYAPFSLG